ncbi:hypothetical protein J3F84DRAFT_345054 [Trichoderma pleuroticola]
MARAIDREHYRDFSAFVIATASRVSSSGILYREFPEPLRRRGPCRQPQPNGSPSPSIHMPSFDAWLVVFGLPKAEVPPNPDVRPTPSICLEKRPAQVRIPEDGLRRDWSGGGNSNLSGNPGQTPSAPAAPGSQVQSEGSVSASGVLSQRDITGDGG